MSSKTILLVEDNSDARELMKLAFSKSSVPHNLVMVSDGIEALDYLLRKGRYSNRNSQHMPSLVLLDINSPKINGIEVLKNIRTHPQLKLLSVVIVSSPEEPQDLIDSYINRCNSYIRKPIHCTQLQNFVREISTYWFNLNQLPPVFGVLNE